MYKRRYSLKTISYISNIPRYVYSVLSRLYIFDRVIILTRVRTKREKKNNRTTRIRLVIMYTGKRPSTVFECSNTGIKNSVANYKIYGVVDIVIKTRLQTACVYDDRRAAYTATIMMMLITI